MPASSVVGKLNQKLEQSAGNWHHSALPAVPASSASAGHSGRGTAGPRHTAGAPVLPEDVTPRSHGPSSASGAWSPNTAHGLCQLALKETKKAPSLYIVTWDGA